jgi:hypothetical protein
MLLHVDVGDVLIIAGSRSLIDNVKGLITAKWKCSDICEAAFILGFKIGRDVAAREIELSQGAYVQGLLERFDIKDPSIVRTPVKGTR